MRAEFGLCVVKEWIGCIVLCVAMPLGLRAQAPVVTSFSPKEGGPTSSVEICGSNLSTCTAVEFNGTAAARWFWMAECIFATVPSGASKGPITVRTAKGSFTTLDEFTPLPVGPPVITSFTPTTTEVGRVVMISGENLIDVVEIKFSETPAAFHWMGSLFAVVPPEAQDGPITLTTKYGSFTTKEPFVVSRPVYGPPVVFSFSPTSGPPNTLVQIRATNFFGLVSVAFGGIETRATWMGDEVLARVPTNALTGPITLTTTNGSFTTTDIFTVLPIPPPSPPVLGMFLPMEGGAGDEITISGQDFDRVTEVTFNGVKAHFTIVPSMIMGWGSTLIKAIVPPDATSGPVTVTAPEGTSTWMVGTWVRQFTVQPKPLLTALIPSHGPPGTIVQLIGTNLDRTTSVALNGVAVPFNKDALTFTVPYGASSGPVTLRSVYGPSSSSALFDVTHTGDLIIGSTVAVETRIVPARLQYTVTITNQGTETVTGVRVDSEFHRSDRPLPDGTAMDPNVWIDTDSRLVPVGASASQGHCVVTNQDVRCELGDLPGHGTAAIQIELAANRGGMIYQLASVSAMTPDPAPLDNQTVSASWVRERPIPTTFSPGTGPPGTPVELRATCSSGFAAQNGLDRVTAVYFDGVPSTFTVNPDAFTLTALVPDNGTSGEITVATPEGAFQFSNSFTVLPEAVLSGFTPDHGPPGTVVRLIGTDLDRVLTLRLGPQLIEFTRTPDLSFVVPSNALTAPLTITLPHSRQTSTDVFTVNRPQDLGISASCSMETALVPTVIRYVIQVVNKGPEPIPGVVLTHRLARLDAFLANPASELGDGPSDGSLTVFSASATQGECVMTEQRLRSELGEMAPYATATIQVEVQVTKRGVVYQQVNAQTGAGPDPDPDPRDNTCGLATLVVDSAELMVRQINRTRVEVGWASTLTGYVLQAKGAGVGAEWSDMNLPATRADGWSRVSDHGLDRIKLYRLRKE